MRDVLFGLSPSPIKAKRSLTSADKKRVAHSQNWKCKACKKLLPVRYHVDHIKPVSQGGSDRTSNLQALCSNCHDRKTEEERHLKKQKKTREKSKAESQSIFGSTFSLGNPKRNQSDIMAISSSPSLQRSKKKQGRQLDFRF